LAALALVPSYYIFWAKPDLVYEQQLVNIPLPENLGKNLPNVLVLLKLQNTGHRPSESIQGNISVRGQLLYFEVHGPNPAYGKVEFTGNDSQIELKCSRLAPGEYPIKISAWVKGRFEEPDAAFADSLGAVRKVRSVDEEEHKLRTIALLPVVGVGSLVAVFALSAAIAYGFVAYFARSVIEAVLKSMKIPPFSGSS
jgi:hypothetical protein